MHAISCNGRTMQAKKLDAFLLEAGLNSLMPHAQRVIAFRSAFEPLLPDNLRRSCSIANISQGKVVIFAENSAVAAKLRLLLPTLEATVAKRLGQVTAMEVRVQPKSSFGYTPRRRDLSPRAGEKLAELASQLPDSELKNAVTALSRRHVGKR